MMTEESNAPLYAALLNYVRDNPARFHMPGHKGGALPPLGGVFGDMLGFDVTELPETDSLFEDDGAILAAERLAAQFYGTRETLFSAGGSTLCMQAMLRLAAQANGGGKIICARNLHRAAVNTMALLDLEPIFVWPRSFEGSSLPGAIAPADIESALAAHGDVTAVLLTSPDYYGVLSDIAGIAAVCHRRKVPLLVDNAHGAHLICFDLHPVTLGADMSCDSAHKTLPALTGGSFLQLGTSCFGTPCCGTPYFSRDDAKAAMTLFGSTSPSYLIMLSLDLARAWIAKDGRAAFAKLAGRVSAFRERCAAGGFFTPQGAVFDPARITIDTGSRGISGGDAAQVLRKCGVSPEMHDDRHVVLLPSPFNRAEDFARLEAAVETLKTGPALKIEARLPKKPERAMRMREAIFAKSETVDTTNSAGRVAAEAKCPIPPCVPLVMPGEQISKEMATSLKSYGVLTIKVVK
jgi:arginine decarboxylase